MLVSPAERRSSQLNFYNQSKNMLVVIVLQNVRITTVNIGCENLFVVVIALQNMRFSNDKV